MRAVDMAKRPDGELEYEVLSVLWSAGEPLSPSAVNDRLRHGLAYTTVATVLSRLHRKRLVSREPEGRGYVYRALVDEAEFALSRIGEVLEHSSDRLLVLTKLFDRLPEAEAVRVHAVISTRSA